MLKSEALRFFKTNRAIAQALGIDESAVSKWGANVPALRSYQLRELMAQQQGKQDDVERLEFPKEAA